MTKIDVYELLELSGEFTDTALTLLNGLLSGRLTQQEVRPIVSKLERNNGRLKRLVEA